MFLTVQVVTVLLVSVAMSLALAHALELPGKMRLDKEHYLTVQSIYYPGFTIGGFAEGVGIVATLVLLLMTSTNNAAFWWTFIGFIALVAMHVVYWVITHPVNNFWLKDQHLKGAGAAFFSLDPAKRGGLSEKGGDDWKHFRNRWEYSHVLRFSPLRGRAHRADLGYCDLNWLPSL